jgi:esterase/lipase superfamily enzyme
MIANYWPFPHAAFISYEWGSAGDLRRYEDDEATIARSSPKLRAFLEQLMEWSPRRPIFVVAHSMGSRAVMDALIGLQDRRKAWPGRAAPLLPSMRPIDDAEAASSTPILMTMLIAPDIGASEFASAFQTGKDAIWRATKYFMLFGSPADRALELSAGKHGAVRAGQGPDIVRNIPGIVYVDCARCYALDLFGHSYQADAARQVADSLRRTLGRKQ